MDSLGEKAAETTAPLCPVKVLMTAAVAASQSLAVLSDDPVSTFEPSREKETEVTPPLCPVNVLIMLFAEISQSLAVLSVDPASTVDPSGEKHTEPL
jgi:hypothetical protein